MNECKHYYSCGLEYCPMEDDSGFLSCDEWEAPETETKETEK